MPASAAKWRCANRRAGGDRRAAGARSLRRWRPASPTTYGQRPNYCHIAFRSRFWTPCIQSNTCFRRLMLSIKAVEGHHPLIVDRLNAPKGDSVALIGGRRMGKTSVLEAVRRALEASQESSMLI